MQENKKAALQFCKNAKRRTAIVHSYDIDFIPLVVQEWRVIPMKYLSTFEVAEKWGISHRRVGILCNENRIPGAQRAGGRWIIPENAEKPADARVKSGKYIKSKTKD